MPRVLVIGGKGFLGAKVVAALKTLPKVDVSVGSLEADSSKLVELDLNDAATFNSMKDFDFIVNCSDSFRALPDKAIDYCLQKGLTFLETSADPHTIERILLSHRGAGKSKNNSHQGIVILGLGIFPGLSNILAKELYNSLENCKRLEVGIRFNPLSGAGQGMCNLMAYLLETNEVIYRNGQRVEERPFSKGIGIKFAGTEHASLKAGFPESIMLHWSTGVPDTAAYFSPAPGFIRPIISLFANTIYYARAVRRPLLWLFRQGCTLLRGKLLRNKKTYVWLTAMGNRQSDSEQTLSINVTDGLRGAAYVICAAIAVLSNKSKLSPGLYLSDEVLKLSEVVDYIAGNTEDEVKVLSNLNG